MFSENIRVPRPCQGWDGIISSKLDQYYGGGWSGFTKSNIDYVKFLWPCYHLEWISTSCDVSLLRNDIWYQFMFIYIQNKRVIGYWLQCKTHLNHATCCIVLSKTSMMTTSNGNIFCVTGHLCGEFTGPRWIPHTKASDAELWCFVFYLRPNKRLSKHR